MNIFVQRRVQRCGSKHLRAVVCSSRVWLVVAVGSPLTLGCDNTMDDGQCGSQVAGSLNLGIWWGTTDAKEVRPQTTYGFGGLGVFGAGLALGSSFSPPPPQSSEDTNTAEDDAYIGLVRNYERCNPDVDATTDNREDKAALLSKVEALPAQPSAEELRGIPDLFQTNAGQTALQYAACGARSSTILAPLSAELWPDGAWSSPALPDVPQVTDHGNRLEDGAVWLQRIVRNSPYADDSAEVLRRIYPDKSRWIRDYISCEGDGERQYWVAPIAIHHLNRLYFNRNALANLMPEAAASESPDFGNVEAWLTRLEQWSRQDSELIPFALPNDDTSGWAVNLLAAENVRVALNLASGRPPNAAEGDLEVLHVMERLRAVSQLGKTGEEWSVAEAMQAVADGKALFTVMGDWSYPDVGPKGVGMTFFPGTKYARVYTIDGFAAVNKNRVPGIEGATQQARAWMRTITSPSVADEFAADKGALVVSDWLQEVGNCALEAAKDPKHPGDCWVMPALSMSAPQCDTADMLRDWLSDPSFPQARLNAAEQLAGRCGGLIDPPADLTPGGGSNTTRPGGPG